MGICGRFDSFAAHQLEVVDSKRPESESEVGNRTAPPTSLADVQRNGLLNADADDGIVVDGSTPVTDDAPVIRKDRFKGKRVEFASTAGIETFEEIAEDFMLEIFGFQPRRYLITDLSSLHDFVGVDDMEVVDMLARIRDVCQLDVADISSGHLLEIVRRLNEQEPEDHR